MARNNDIEGKADKPSKDEYKKRITQGWVAFNKLKNVFCSDMPRTAKIFDQYVLPIVIYGTETWALNKSIIYKLQVIRSAMVSISLRDKKKKGRDPSGK